jgi:hypothetical protein
VVSADESHVAFLGRGVEQERHVAASDGLDAVGQHRTETWPEVDNSDDAG